MALFITGTGTDVGKTLFSALVMTRYAHQLGLRYLKPIQTGDNSDRATVTQLSGLESAYFLPELYHFRLAAAPHFAAESEGRAIDADALVTAVAQYRSEKTIIELAGGLMVPLSRYYTNLDLVRTVGFPTVLVAATGLGTINHTVLAYNALKEAGIKCLGIFFIGRENPLRADNIRTIIDMTGATNLGLFLLPEHQMAPHEFREAAENFDSGGRVRGLLT